MRAIAGAALCCCLGLVAEPLLGNRLEAQTWCVTCDWQMGWCKITDGYGFYYCANLGGGCQLLCPGCGDDDSRLNVTPDGTRIPPVAWREVDPAAWSPLQESPQQSESDQGVSVLRRRCDGAILARLYSPAVAAARREQARILVL
mgnify:FL=1